jgi:hypothetical protein
LPMILKKIVEELEQCQFSCEAGPLENHAAFKDLKKIAEKEAAAATTAEKWTAEIIGVDQLEKVDLRKVKDVHALAEQIKPCIPSKESDDSQC